MAQGLFPHHPLIFNYMNIQVADAPGEDLVQHFPKCFEFIDRAIGQGGARRSLLAACGLLCGAPAASSSRQQFTARPRCWPRCLLARAGSVLVHCAAGVSRSATVVLGYLMSHRQLDLAAAVAHLKAVRPWVSPNDGERRARVAAMLRAGKGRRRSSRTAGTKRWAAAEA